MMKIVVCVRQGLDGDISPFDAAAYEAALQVENSEVTLLAMGPATAGEWLYKLTRLGAKRAVHLCDPAFAGADTLATAYALSRALERIPHHAVFCGRQTLVGDTGQTGPMLAELLGASFVPSVLSLPIFADGNVACETRENQVFSAPLPALLTFERGFVLRRPSLFGKYGEMVTWTAADIDADPARCGLGGSPTRVLETTENQSGRRRCTFLPATALREAVEKGLAREKKRICPQNGCENKLKSVFAVGESVLDYANPIGDTVTVLPADISADALLLKMEEEHPGAVLFAADIPGRTLAATVGARRGLGLCADCTALETDGETLYMIRPARGGSIMARIKSLTTPALATVRVAGSAESGAVVAAGWGAKGAPEKVAAIRAALGAAPAASRKAVEEGLAPYAHQVGLTGRSIAPAVYVALGISGAVHHIVGMEQSGTVIAVNPDKNAPIFDYADFGIVARVEDLEF